MSLTNEQHNGQKSGGILQSAKFTIAEAIDKVRLPKPDRNNTRFDVRHSRKEFQDLPVYAAMEKHKDIATAMNLANPFYRSHEKRSGAMTWMGGMEHINFASYDYLGLAQHPVVLEAAKAAIDAYGASVSASRIVAGERPIHGVLEAAIADFYEAEAAVTFVSGHATNVSTIDALLNQADLIVYDELIHNSAHVGAKLSGATCKSFAHNNMAALEKILREHRAKHKQALIIVEGLYSMDGDFPDLRPLVELKDQYGCWLMVDEAHSLGVLGETGRGIAEHYGVDPRRVDIWMGTLSKTLGTCGGYIAGNNALIEILKYQAAGFVYSVGMSPPMVAGAYAALEVLKNEPERVRKLQDNGALFLAEAKKAGLNTATSEGFSVVPVIVGDSVKAVKLTEALLKRGVNALPIIYPAVPLKQERIRFFITAEHTPEQIREAVRVTAEELEALSKARVKRMPVAKLQASLAMRSANLA